MKRHRTWCIVLAALLTISALQIAAVTAAELKLPNWFSRNMVLQRDMPVPVWGWANAGEEVTVTIAGQTKSTTTDASGRWRLKLDKLAAGGPHTLTVKGKITRVVNDVLVGEVWLASGQSNMVHIMPYYPRFKEELANCNFPQLRILTAGGGPLRAPRDDGHGIWRPCGPDSLDDVSAVSYFFGRELHERLGVPVGIITAALGSTPIEAWTSIEAQQSCPEVQELLATWQKKSAEYDHEAALAAYTTAHRAWEAEAAAAKAAGKPAPREPKVPLDPRDQQQHPAVMFNTMIAPLAGYGIRGAIWYQGEYNAQTEDYARLYRYQLPLMVRDWRDRWGQGNFPFAWVQLPNFETTTRTPVMTGWPLVREGMLQSLSVPNTGMIVSIDLGEATSVHPSNKKPFAQRLAGWARAEVYGERIPWSGPLLAAHRTSGDTIELSFRHADGSLMAKGSELRGFVICGADKNWRPALARIEHDKVLVSSPEVKQPVAVRYSWAANPDGNLVNAAGLPASPFSTDVD